MQLKKSRLFFGGASDWKPKFKTKFKCVVMAYNKDGTPKRSVGVMYPDIGVYTPEMDNEVNGKRAVSNKKQVRKNGRSKGKRAPV